MIRSMTESGEDLIKKTFKIYHKTKHKQISSGYMLEQLSLDMGRIEERKNGKR